MIKKIIAHNFQSHKHTEVELNEGFTVVVGDSDQGKTSLIKRCLLWCFFNEPNGNEFVRYREDGKLDKHGERIREDLCFVTVEFDDDTIVTRKRIKNKNVYELTTPDGEVNIWDKDFKNEVPYEIQEAIKIKKFIIDDDIKLNVNIIGSRDESLLDKTGSVKAKIIGSFAGTNVIDIANRSTNVDISNEKQQEKLLLNNISEIQSKIESFGEIEEYEAVVDEALKIIEEVEEIENKKNKILEIKSKIEQRIAFRSKLIEEISTEKEVLKEISLLETVSKEADDCKYQIEKLDLLISKFNSINNRKNLISSLKKEIATETQVNNDLDTVAKIEKEVSEIEVLINNINKIKTVNTSINSRKEFNQKLFDIIATEEKTFIYEDKLNFVEKSIKEHFEVIEAYNAKIAEIQKHLNSINEISLNSTRIKNKFPEMEKLFQNELTSYIDAIKSLGICPCCEQKISEQHLSNIKNDLMKGWA